MTRYHIFGDTGGHFRQLKAGLVSLGMDPDTFKLPEDIVVVHCGDLLHKGPNSAAVIFMVNRVMEANPGQWVQLLGNHEYHYLGGITFWRESIDRDAISLLRQWKEEGKVKHAHLIKEPAVFHGLVVSKRGYQTPANKPVVLTHAGITRQYWEKFLRSEEDAGKLVERLNSFSPAQIGTPGAIIGADNTRAYPAGPIWALSVEEVWASWKNTPSIPFIQVHGHTTPYAHSRGRWFSLEREFQQASKVNPSRRTCVTAVGDSVQIAVDPGYDKFAPDESQPSLLVTA